MIPIRPELTPELQALAARAEMALKRALPSVEQPPARLHEAMRYSVLGGGKRLRPLLVYAACACLGGSDEDADAAAVAVEIIHAYSLIHDDLPAMDDDDLRRNRPTCHIVFGEATAILAGDALQALAFEVLAGYSPSQASDHQRIEMLRVLAVACGAYGMAGGQALDLEATGSELTLAGLEHMHTQKTGALIRASVLLGALSAGCNDSNALDVLDAYGAKVGLAFQIRDDILDIEGNTQDIGKRQGADIARGKATYPSIIGVEAARSRADSLRGEAWSLLSIFGPTAEPLRDLAHYAVDRVN